MADAAPTIRFLFDYISSNAYLALRHEAPRAIDGGERLRMMRDATEIAPERAR
jgi:hypothetical protein